MTTTTVIDRADLDRVAGRLSDLGYTIAAGLSDAALRERIDYVLTDGASALSMPYEPPACRSWCDGTHGDDGQFRDCSSPEVLIGSHDAKFGDRQIGVGINTTFDRATGLSIEPHIYVEDVQLTPAAARQLAGQLYILATQAESE